MKIRGILLAAMSALALTACDDLEGTISVKSKLNIVNKKGKSAVISAGTYQSSFDYDSDKRRLKIKVKDVAGDDQKLELNLPQGVEIPTYSGDFSILGSQVGQDWNLAGNVDTQTDVGGQVRTTETCTLYRQEYVCRQESYKDQNGNIHYRDVCGYEQVPYNGSRDVEYHSETTTVRADAEFTDSSTGSQLAVLHASRSSYQTIYDYVGTCVGGWGWTH